RLQIFSDLHVDVDAVRPVVIGTDVDLVVVAGDTAEGATRAFQALRRIVPEPITIAMTMGNHEFYGSVHEDELAVAREAAPAFNVVLLENEVAVIGGCRLAGATLWSDYRLFGPVNAPAAMHAARVEMNDHRRIRWSKKPWRRFRPEEALSLHGRSRAFLADVVATPFDGPTVIVCHHAPHIRSVGERFSSDVLSAAFASDALRALFPQDNRIRAPPGDGNAEKRVELWIHGHVRHSVDYEIAGIRVLANPHGYGEENPEFNPQLIIEVKS
ncbi:MAG TPA: metallophosphoesterase, partial [Thermomicrobiales bacterium]|nr:metallophosphoesterase [Thermomicrobiales bacterium]